MLKLALLNNLGHVLGIRMRNQNTYEAQEELISEDIKSGSVAVEQIQLANNSGV